MSQRSVLARMTARHGAGCFVWLAVYAAVAAALHRYMAPHVVEDARLWVALGAGVFIALGLSNVWQLLMGYGSGDDSRDAQLARAAEGRMPSADGPAVARGTIRALGTPLRAPISGVECVSYMYTMFYEARVGTNTKRIRVPVYWGHASRPFVVDTPAQQVRVLAVPRLLDGAARLHADEDVARARAYVAAAAFEEVGDGLVNAMGSVGEIVAAIFGDEDGEERKDWARAEKRDPDTLILEELALAVGQDASVSGNWSVARQALVTSVADREAEPVTVTRGSVERLTGVQGTLPHSRLSVAITAILLIALGAGIVWAAAALGRR